MAENPEPDHPACGIVPGRHWPHTYALGERDPGRFSFGQRHFARRLDCGPPDTQLELDRYELLQASLILFPGAPLSG